MPVSRRAWHRMATLAAALALGACGGGDEATTITQTPSAEDGETAPSEGTGGRAPVDRAVLSPAGVRELERFADSAAGEVGIAVAPLGDGDAEEIGSARTGHAWSTMKVPLLVALIERLGGADELSAGERSQAEAALTRSDNDAALALFDRLAELEGGVVPASRAIQEVLRRSGDAETEVNTEPSPEGFSTFGQTIWSAGNATRFFRALAGGCLLPRADTDFVLALLERVVADQRWGLGEAATPGGAAVAFKGGWGPEADGGYLVRQSGIVVDGGRGYAVSVIAIPGDAGAGSFAAGQGLLGEAVDLVAEDAGAGPEGRITCEP